MQTEGILYLQLHNLNFQACVDGRRSLGEAEENN